MGADKAAASDKDAKSVDKGDKKSSGGDSEKAPPAQDYDDFMDYTEPTDLVATHSLMILM